jgi:hypothetical protein
MTTNNHSPDFCAINRLELTSDLTKQNNWYTYWLAAWYRISTDKFLIPQTTNNKIFFLHETQVPVACGSSVLSNRQACLPCGLFALSSANEMFIVLLLVAVLLSIFKSVLEYNMQNTYYKILPAYFFPRVNINWSFLISNVLLSTFFY